MSFKSTSLIVGKAIGSGSLGHVYAAKWEGRKVAIKMLYAVWEEDTNPILHEVRVLEQLRDKSIIQFYGIAKYQDSLVVIMEYANGGNLMQAITRGQLVDDWVTKERIAREIARGINYIHHKNILHRDLKSANVLLTKHMEVKLCGFGLSIVRAASDSGEMISSHAGTLRYMAPELLIPQPRFTTKSDMYAVGMIMWEIAADCTPPFKDTRDSMIVVERVKNGAREILPEDTPPMYRHWVERCWDQDPSRRPEAWDMTAEHDSDSEEEVRADYSFGFNTLSISDTLSGETNEVKSQQSDSDDDNLHLSNSSDIGAQAGVMEPPLRRFSIIMESPLGSGATCTVYKGLWGTRVVAFKKFNISEHESRHENVRAEIELMQTLRDRHIIQFYGEDYYKDRLVIVMEYAEGGSLKKAIEGFSLDWQNKARIAHEIARGLEYIHSQNVLHRDLKSANVLLTKHMEVKLCDFGLSQVRTMDLTKSTDVYRGTLRWSAPELLALRPTYSVKSDVYALGMIMWEMAANCSRPFSSQDNDSILGFLILTGAREEVPEDTPADYREWIERCWLHDPAARPTAKDICLVATETRPISESDDANYVPLGDTIW